MKQSQRFRTVTRTWLALASTLALSITGLGVGSAYAQEKTLRMVVGYPAGGAVDVVARQLGEAMRGAGYSVVIDNKAGAAGQLAVQLLLQAPADGKTVILMPGGNLSIYTHVYPNLKYKLDDLAPVATVCAFNFALALGPGTPARTLQDFIAWARANPGKASYGSPGAGTGMHFMGVMLGQKAGFEFVHVPYKGGANATTDLLGGTLPALATTLPNLVKLHQSGKLRIVGFTGDKRLPKLPDVPTFREQGYPDIVLSEVFAVFASAKTPSDLLNSLEGSVMAAARSTTVRQALEKLEFESQVLDGRTTRANLLASLKAWGPIIQSSGYSISK
ncbi:MAG: hypothetical protein RL322_2926 [Pseudomonadota bacterium]|jgi:tripartite-type tricarboxylate transporter receptor subunit TctC